MTFPTKGDGIHDLRSYFVDTDGRVHGTGEERNATAADPVAPENEWAPRVREGIRSQVASRLAAARWSGRKRMKPFPVRAIGHVESELTDLASAPRQADEGAPPAWLVFDEDMAEGLRSLRVGEDVLVMTWLDRARRDVLSVHPRGDTSRAEEGVFSTRSPHRPNPIGLHRVEITDIDGTRVRVRHLEAIQGTPIIDVKPILSDDVNQR